MIVALLIGYESVDRLRAPIAIDFDQAIFIALVGLVVNLVSAWLLYDQDHHGHAHGHQAHSHNAHEHHAHDDHGHHHAGAGRIQAEDRGRAATFPDVSHITQ